VITSGITSPDFPRTVTAKGSASGVAGNVTVIGTNIWGEVISSIIALSGSSEVEGTKAFATVTEIDLPVESHIHAAQVETATVVGTISKAGNAAVIVTCTGMAGTPKTLSVAVALNDTAAQVAEKIRAALAADSAVTALFTVSRSGADIILTKITVAANITNLNVDIDNDTCEGLTDAPTSADTVTGVAYDTVSVGIAKKFGLPQIAYNAACVLLALFNGSADTGGTLAVDDDEVEKNLYSCAGTPNGSRVLDLYYVA
jgi:phage tail sheath gpL-like